jgi:hypothetical protein
MMAVIAGCQLRATRQIPAGKSQILQPVLDSYISPSEYIFATICKGVSAAGLSKMLAIRSFAAPARRQCFQASARAIAPTSVQSRRHYAKDFSAKEKVAKFHGEKGPDGLYTVSLIEGDGIGPEISQSVKDIFTAAKVLTVRSKDTQIY